MTTQPRALGVSYINQRTGLVIQAKAHNEVIVSMGTFHSPQLLMVSISSQSFFQSLQRTVI
ncbi:hypothetical protein P153DRAFT_34058 [Dothidotthia symphoricarpi CBS 119687]|uniref:Glucose-methanol-choline oxidoreductase N-terminal domain-containing protein n=1 Tax=Dothidotthia symphoricarpi CBS 119687 TaxID=1392245 RepID=A0A6A6A8G5_9PLEO|nr:uncharacterized protein P153DRAFT_34058 [Dothidotthia symphoricarpi CBS 119687]KAF2128262.1 hypothetical protein P153DRAFT_34058 [Dothidotthia symphoricarpi CBS 119687]